MKQPLYKKALSYLRDIHIESTGSDYNEVLDLYLVKGRYQLCTENAIYSYGDKYDNFANAFHQVDLSKVKDVLVLGLGLASIPFILEKIHKKDFAYTGVEIDDEVVYLASKYVLDDLKSEVQIYNTDAYAFMSLNESKYDLICMDVFVDDKIPEELESEDFLELLRDALTKEGILIYNRLSYPAIDKGATNTFYEQVFKQLFPRAKSYETGGNLMLFNK
jgi:spermidine synthase